MRILLQYKGLSKVNYALAVGRFVTSMGTMIIPMLTLILNQKIGMSATDTALWIMFAGLIMLPANLIGGHLADFFDKKRFIIICDCISIALYLYCGFTTFQFSSLYIIIIAGFFQNMETPAYNALVAQITPNGMGDKAYSLQYLAANVGGAMASVIAGFLFYDYFWLCFLLDGFTIGCSTLLIAFFVQVKKEDVVSSEYATKVEGIEKKGSFLSVIWKNPIVLTFILSFVLYQAGYSQFTYLMPIEFTKYHGTYGAKIYGTVMSLNCILAAILIPTLTKITDKWMHQKKLIYGIFLQMLSFFLFLQFMGVIPCYYVVIVIFTLGEVLTAICYAVFLTEHTEEAYHGRIFGFSSFLCSIGGGFVMWFSGNYVDAEMDGLAWIFSIWVTTIALIFGIWCHWKETKEKKCIVQKD